MKEPWIKSRIRFFKWSAMDLGQAQYLVFLLQSGVQVLLACHYIISGIQHGKGSAFIWKILLLQKKKGGAVWASCFLSERCNTQLMSTAQG